MKNRVYKLSSLEEILLKNRWEEMSPQKRLEEVGILDDARGYAKYLEKNRRRLAGMRNYQLQGQFYY